MARSGEGQEAAGLQRLPLLFRGCANCGGTRWRPIDIKLFSGHKNRRRNFTAAAQKKAAAVMRLSELRAED